jgi:hypothetical protein
MNTLPCQTKDSTAGTMFAKILEQPLHVEDTPESDTTPQMAKLRQKIVKLGDTFTTFVDWMRQTLFLAERVRNMGGKIEEIVPRQPERAVHAPLKCPAS